MLIFILVRTLQIAVIVFDLSTDFGIVLAFALWFIMLQPRGWLLLFKVVSFILWLDYDFGRNPVGQSRNLRSLRTIIFQNSYNCAGAASGAQTQKEGNSCAYHDK